MQGKQLQDKVQDESLGEITYEKLIRAKFTEKYHDTIDEVIIQQQEERREEKSQRQSKEGDKAKESKQEEEKGFGTFFSKNLNRDNVLFIKSLSQLTPIEDTSETTFIKTETVEDITPYLMGGIRRSQKVH